MDSDSESNLVIITNRDRFNLFGKLYWRAIVILITPLLWLPILFVNKKNAYNCFYIFLITISYWITDAMHPSIVALIPIALATVMGSTNTGFISEMYIRNELLDCLGVMMIGVAVENARIHRRVALKLLLVFGCSHYRLSFLLFFTTMFMSMWISNIIACGLMMPLVKAVLMELEKMGILEMYQSIGKDTQKSSRHDQKFPRPTDFTVFYFLGIAYSSSIGGMATIMGSQTNQILKRYCETIFPTGPKIEFPHFMLLNLPGVLVMESLLYMWMNFYFLGLFRAQSDIALEIGMTEDEAQYIDTLLVAQYQQMGRIKFHEGVTFTALPSGGLALKVLSQATKFLWQLASTWRQYGPRLGPLPGIEDLKKSAPVVGIVVILTALLQATLSGAYFENEGLSKFHNHFRVSSPCYVCVILLFMIPVNLNFLKFFQRRSDLNEPLPNAPSKACLNWDLIRNNIHWSILFIIGGSGTLFESLRDSGMTDEMEKFLLLFEAWPASALVLVVILFCKIITEFASNSCVVYCLLPNIARLAVLCDVNPHYLMMAATLSCSLPFHLVTGTPVNAMVCAYVHIPPWKMMYAGIGPSVIAVVVTWFTVAAWSTAIWTDINLSPDWADTNIFDNKDL